MEYSDSYIAAICDKIDELVATFGFNTAGVTGRSLGNDAANAVAESISEDCREGIAPDGSEWDKNKDPYARWKAAKFGVHDPGYRTGETLSLKALKGEVVVSDDTVVMRHGTGATDSTGASDKQKGQWLTDGDPKRNRPKRRFYLLNDQRAAKVLDVLKDGLSRHVSTATGGI